MNLIQIIDDLKVGGAQQTLVTMAQAFPHQQHRLTIISLRDEAPLCLELRALGAEVLILNSQQLISLRFIWRLARCIGARTEPRVQTHLLYANVIGGLASALARVPVCGTLHAHDEHPRYRRTLKRHVETLVMRLCNRRWIAVAPSVALSHRKRLPGPRMQVLENAVSMCPPGPIAGGRDNLRQREFDVPANSSARVSICVARLVAVKGHVDLIRAFALARPQRPHDRLVLIGDGPERPALQDLIAQLKLHNCVLLKGHRRDVPQLLQAADLYVSAAHSEGLPIALLEAMAAGLPVVHTRVGEVASVIDHRCGILTAPHDPAAFATALAAMLEEPSLAGKGQRARRIVAERFDSSAWLTRLLDTLRVG